MATDTAKLLAENENLKLAIAEVTRNNLELMSTTASLEQHTVVLEQHAVALEQHAVALEQHKVTLEQDVARLKLLNEKLRHLLHGSKSEKLSPEELERQRQAVLSLFGEDPSEPNSSLAEKLAKEAPDAEESTRSERRRTRKHPGRTPFPDHLPRKRVEVHPPQEALICPCCDEPMQVIGEEITEEYGRIPAQLFVRQIVRPKYACSACEEGVVIADLPARPIEKGRAGADVLSHVLVSKYADHLPLYRQEAMFRRQGVEITRASMCGWVDRSAALLKAITNEMHREMLSGDVIASDDTRVQMQDASRRGRTRRAFFWTYVGESGDVLYDFTVSRSRHGPLRFLEGFSGYLQADAYSGYEELYRGGSVCAVGCMAHARRKFHDAHEAFPVESKEILRRIQGLYLIEAEAKLHGISAKDLRALRQRESIPRLRQLHRHLKHLSKTALPQSQLGQAVSYTLGQWVRLCRYTMDGRLEIDNNRSERAMRPIAVGRKNWLFAGSVAGGERAAVIYSLIESCKRHGVNPQCYLTDVLERVCTHPNKRIAELTPRQWKNRFLDEAMAKQQVTIPAAE